MKSIIRLFKAIPIKNRSYSNASPKNSMINYANVSFATIGKGFIFGPEVVSNYNEKELTNLISIVENEFGITPQQMNSTFHKSWEKVRDAPMFQLVMEQIVHYITTYGFEELGIFNESTVYIPIEKLEIPALTGGINLTVIRGYTYGEIKEKIINMLNQGIALKEETIDDVVHVANVVGFSDEEIKQVKNKEVKIKLYDKLNTFPENPTEFLRYLIYKATGKTLLIKNKATIIKIKEASENTEVASLFIKYHETYGLEKLATIFYRFKPLFLAFKGYYTLSGRINKIRKMATYMHTPMKKDLINDITNMLSNCEDFKISAFENALTQVSIFRKIRLAYALKFRTRKCDSILYRIRNGKAYAKEFNYTSPIAAGLALEYVKKSIVSDIRNNVEGKRIYIPEYVVYALPATEKQFTGNFPSGSYITVPQDMIMGVYWENLPEGRVDLDLSAQSLNVGKIGWDSSYRSHDRSILFSGDLTDASKGATELFYVKHMNKDTMLMMLNFFNQHYFTKDTSVPFKIMIATKDDNQFTQGDRYIGTNHYMINPNNLICTIKSEISSTQKILGMLDINNDCKFYFIETNIGETITSKDGKYTEQSRKFLYTFYTSTITLNEILALAGAKIITEKGQTVDIDLSPENLEKDTIMKLLYK